MGDAEADRLRKCHPHLFSPWDPRLVSQRKDHGAGSQQVVALSGPSRELWESSVGTLADGVMGSGGAPRLHSGGSAAASRGCAAGGGGMPQVPSGSRAIPGCLEWGLGNLYMGLDLIL